MTIYRLPVFEGDRFFTYRVELEGETYGLQFSFLARTQSWYLNITDDNDEPIVSGQRLGNDLPFFKRYKDTRLPPGMLVTISIDDDNSPPTLDDFGERVRLLYFDESDLVFPPVSDVVVDVVAA